MEIPYAGRAIITDNLDKVEIVIPGKRNYFILLFFSAWMVGWFFGETSALKQVGNNGAIDLFMIAWLTAWTLGGIFVVSNMIFILLSKEIIEAGQGTISIRNSAAFFLPAKVYDLIEVKHIRASEEFSIYNSFQFGRKQRGVLSNFNSGTVKFDYGLKTVKFGNDLDEAEARYIIERLKGKKILTERNF